MLKNIKKHWIWYVCICIFLNFINLLIINNKSTKDTHASLTIPEEIENISGNISCSNNKNENSLQLLSAVKTFYKELSEIEQVCLNITKINIEIEEILMPKNFYNHTFIMKSRDRLKNLNEKVNLYENERKKITDKFISKIANIYNLSSNDFERVKIESERENGENGIKKYISIIKELILSCDDFLSSLDLINGFYKVSGERVIFSRKNDLETFNSKKIMINDFLQKAKLQSNKMHSDNINNWQSLKRKLNLEY